MTGHVTLSAEDSRTILGILHNMPYGGSASMGLGRLTPGEEYRTEELARDLQRLSDTLRGVAEQHVADAAELEQLRRERAALRSLLGTTPQPEAEQREDSEPDPADDLAPSGGQAEQPARDYGRAYPIQVFQSNVDRFRPWEVRSILPGGGFRVLDRCSTHARAVFSAAQHRAAVEAMIDADDAMLRNAR